jgi:midasin
LAKDQNGMSAIGSTWIGLSYFLLELYVTNIPIDPAARRILMGEVSSIRVTQLEEELAAIEQDEMIAKGQSESARTAESRSRLEEAIAEQANLGPASTRSTDSTRLATLFNEVHTFLADALDSSRTSALHSALLQGDPQALQREDGFQAVTGSFVHRLSVNYTDLADLVQPIIMAVLFAKFGFRCLARDLDLRQSTPDLAVKSILAFPSSSTNISSSTSKDLVTQIFETASLSRHLQPGAQRTAFLPDFVAHLGGLYNTWSDIRLREQQDAQEAESLYRVKKTDVEVLSDLEQEEKEFAELFPSYEGITDEDAPTTSKPEPVDKRKFVKERVVAFHQLLVGAFGDNPTHAEIYASSAEEIIQYSYKASAYDDTLDQSSLAYQIRQLHTAQVARSVSAVQPNFYLSPNEPQIRKAYDLVARLVARLEVLIQEWPEQMVLQHIRDRCDRVLALDKRSPVAQILSALEQLLIHTEDWEGFANRENSLKSFQDDASNLIIEWRKLELASWMRLLQDQAQQYIDADAEWSLRLYGALIHGTVNSANHVEHLKSVLPMLNTYLHSSTLGHFASRLQTLTAFEKMAREIASSSPHSEMLLQVATMLHNVIANAKLYEAKLSNSYSTQRSAVDKSIKDFVRLASWKDVNVYALKASAVRSHRQLHRSMRKFRDILQQPISPVMMDLNSLVSQEQPQTSSAPSLSILPVDAPTDVAVQARSEVQLQQPEHLAKLGSTFDKYQSILTNSLSTLNDVDASGEEMDSMAVEAIETAAMLAKATPANLTKDNAKVVKNLASRKRKAYADMLKSLRASGFSNSVRADSLAKQHSMDWLTQRPVLITNGLPADLDTVKKVEGYHHKMAILMIALRAAFNGHNDDIASQDLQRGIGFVESIYATALGSRDR